MIKKLSILLLFAAVILWGCYYDKQSELHPLGAKNNCDTASVTYSNQVMQIVSSTCNGCHFPGGVLHYDFTTWDDLNSSALSGQLMGCVNYQTGFSPMPPSFHLSPCQIRTLQIWVDSGAPQN